MERAIRSDAQRPRPLDQVRDAMRRKYYSYRTEDTYVQWIKRSIYGREIVRTGERGIGTASGRQIGKA